MGTANLRLGLLAYEDGAVTAQPQRRSIDWVRTVFDMPVQKAGTLPPVDVAPYSSVTVFDGSRSLTSNGSTEYVLTPSTLDASRYRLTHTGTGAAPGFRTARTVAIGSSTVTVTVFSNQTVTLASSNGAIFGSVQVGDTVFLPGVTTGDTAGPFSADNEGEWTVLAASTSLTLARPSGVGFSGKTESVAVGSDSSVQAYSTAGVQVGDFLDISAGFSASTRKAFVIAAVTASRVDFTSTAPLAGETAVPGAGGLKVYSGARWLVVVESDQEVSVRLNGSTEDSVRLEPILPGSQEQAGIYLKTGSTFSLVLYNRSSVTARCRVFTAER